MAPDLRTLGEEQAHIDRQVLEYSIKLLRPYYEKRRPVLKDISRFWATVVCETEPLRPYILFEDSLAFDELVDLYVEYDPTDSRNFELTMEFNNNPHFNAQTLKKRFIWHEGTKDKPSSEETNIENKHSEDDKDTGYYVSPEPTKINWKSENNLGNAHTNGGEESFFTWFEYTTTDNEDDRSENTAIAQLIIDEVFPNAIDLYKSAQDDQDIAEEYDISDD